MGLDGGILISRPRVIESDVETADNCNDDHDNCRNGGADSPGSSVVCVHDGPPFERRLNETLDEFVPERIARPILAPNAANKAIMLPPGKALP